MDTAHGLKQPARGPTAEPDFMAELCHRVTLLPECWWIPCSCPRAARNERNLWSSRPGVGGGVQGSTLNSVPLQGMSWSIVTD